MWSIRTDVRRTYPNVNVDRGKGLHWLLWGGAWGARAKVITNCVTNYRQKNRITERSPLMKLRFALECSAIYEIVVVVVVVVVVLLTHSLP